MAENVQPIIIKKIKKVSGGHHGGSWKVAYADFVTAMMAFFLLLWLLNVSDPVTLRGISEYFQSPSMVQAAGGASTSIIDLGSNVETAKGEGENLRESDEWETEVPQYSQEFLEQERRQLEDLKAELEQVIEETPNLAQFKDQILLDVTEEGLRIQIVDKDRRPMFDLGAATLKPYARRILRALAPVLNEVPNSISLSGHTDARRFVGQRGYSNWELSAERANASRRELVAAGYPPEKITRVVGLASRVPFDESDPNNPMNRRISIIVLNKKAEDSILRTAGAGMKLRRKEDIPSILPEALREAIRNGGNRTGLIQR